MMSANSPRDSLRGGNQPDQLFAIRMWPEQDSTEVKGYSWRGHVRHTNSGQESEFIDLEAMFDFIRSKAEA